MIPLSDATRRPIHVPIVTICIILTNLVVFVLELTGGEAFALKWSAIPAQIVSGHDWITILTAMFMHGSWSHILENIVFLWAFGPEIEDAMGPWRYSVFYVVGGLVAMLAQVVAHPSSTVPNLGASGAIAAVMGAFLVTYPTDRIRTLLLFFVFVRITFVPAALVRALLDPRLARVEAHSPLDQSQLRCGLAGPIGRRFLGKVELLCALRGHWRHCC